MVKEPIIILQPERSRPIPTLTVFNISCIAIVQVFLSLATPATEQRGNITLRLLDGLVVISNITKEIILEPRDKKRSEVELDFLLPRVSFSVV